MAWNAGFALLEVQGGRQVMFDSDLTESHGIGTKRPNQAVSRKPEERDGDARVSQSGQAAIPPASESVS